MDSERVIRHTFAGIVLTFYLLVFYFLFDGKLNLMVLSATNGEAFYLPIASLLLTTPVIGLTISSTRLHQRRAIYDMGLVKITHNEVVTVIEIIDGFGTIIIEQGKNYRRDMKAQDGQINLFGKK